VPARLLRAQADAGAHASSADPGATDPGTAAHDHFCGTDNYGVAGYHHCSAHDDDRSSSHNHFSINLMHRYLREFDPVRVLMVDQPL
jgi:hypothetical protein